MGKQQCCSQTSFVYFGVRRRVSRRRVGSRRLFDKLYLRVSRRRVGSRRLFDKLYLRVSRRKVNSLRLLGAVGDCRKDI